MRLLRIWFVRHPIDLDALLFTAFIMAFLLTVGGATWCLILKFTMSL